jgi:hypothetical protein
MTSAPSDRAGECCGEPREGDRGHEQSEVAQRDVVGGDVAMGGHGYSVRCLPGL